MKCIASRTSSTHDDEKANHGNGTGRIRTATQTDAARSVSGGNGANLAVSSTGLILILPDPPLVEVAGESVGGAKAADNARTRICQNGKKKLHRFEMEVVHIDLARKIDGTLSVALTIK